MKFLKPRFQNVKALVLDVDGVMTDRRIMLDGQGQEIKSYNAYDGQGIKLLQEHGILVAIITSRGSLALQVRAKELGITELHEHSANKLETLEALCQKHKLPMEHVAYVGDDLPDLAPIQRVGLGIAVADAISDVKEAARYTCQSLGGQGAVREVADLILKSQGRWAEILKKMSALPCLGLLLWSIAGPLLATDLNQAELISLSGYTAEGQKKWDLMAESAEIESSQKINLQNPKGILYKDGSVSARLKSEEGIYNRKAGQIYLEKNVIVRDVNGTQLKSHSIDWDSEASTLHTPDDVTINRENTVITGKNMQVNKNLEKASLKEKVMIKALKDDPQMHPSIITCDGGMEVNYQEHWAEFNDNVVVLDGDITLKAEYMKVYFNKERKSIERIFCREDVLIVKGEQKARSQEAEYDAPLGAISLSGEPKMVKDGNILTADNIIFYFEEEKVVCEPSAQLVLFPTDKDKEVFDL